MEEGEGKRGGRIERREGESLDPEIIGKYFQTFKEITAPVLHTLFQEMEENTSQLIFKDQHHKN